MSLMRFSVQARERLGKDALQRIYFQGLDEIPYACRCSLENGELHVERSEDESGRMVLPWRLTERDEFALKTSTLIDRDRPYILEVEIARGCLNDVRNQVAIWEGAGLVISEVVRTKLTDATHQFARAATSQNDTPAAATIACGVIDQAVELAYLLTGNYTKQALTIRRRATPQLPTLWGVNLGTRIPNAHVAGHLAGAFNLATVPFAWKSIEAVEGNRRWEEADEKVDWCTRTGIKVCGGPLLQLDESGTPDWLYLWEDDTENLQSFMIEHVQAVVKRYRGRVHLWQVAARCNAASPLGFDEEQTLQVIVRAVEAIRGLDPTTPVVVMFDLPWSEYMVDTAYDLTALHFADALVRAEIGLSGVGMEINAGYWPSGTPHRHPVAYSRMLDRWSMLGVPIMMAVTVPSDASSDDRATTASSVLRKETASPERQKAWIETFLPLMLAKNAVQVVLWNQMDDSAPHDFPNGGLFDRTGQPKPALAALRAIRQQYLM